ncbi:hypothetical protein EYZ11_010012 [Aspergillus tanneri]|uniref:WAP domain-containing protein n=1 Tax=Aspergillus tanneri TaxID=1220188 RepID=A0A4S3J8I9_9EURO|nr:hypothetical protein EYZ11_010012 [Aspergillus tanneri]
MKLFSFTIALLVAFAASRTFAETVDENILAENNEEPSLFSSINSDNVDTKRTQITRPCYKNSDCKGFANWCHKCKCRRGTCGSNTECPRGYYCWRGNCTRIPHQHIDDDETVPVGSGVNAENDEAGFSRRCPRREHCFEGWHCCPNGRRCCIDNPGAKIGHDNGATNYLNVIDGENGPVDPISDMAFPTQKECDSKRDCPKDFKCCHGGRCIDAGMASLLVAR